MTRTAKFHESILPVDARMLGFVLVHGPDVTRLIRSEDAMFAPEACLKRRPGETFLPKELLLRLACLFHDFLDGFPLSTVVTKNDASNSSFPTTRMVDDTTVGHLGFSVTIGCHWPCLPTKR